MMRRRRALTEAAVGPPAIGAITPRLLDMHQAAVYLGCSYWTIRDYVLAGQVATVELPALRPREGERPRKRLRRVLIDRAELDAFIERRTNPSARDWTTNAPRIESTNTRADRGSVPNVCPDSRESKAVQKPGGRP